MIKTLNTFFNCLNGRRNRNVIHIVRLVDGFFSYNKAIVKEEFVKYFKKVLNKEAKCHFKEYELKEIIKSKLSPDMPTTLVDEITKEEI